jgi:phytanoyl-CoA hydroxylase
MRGMANPYPNGSPSKWARIGAVIDAEAYERDAFCVLRAFAPRSIADDMHDAAVDLIRRHATGRLDPPQFVTPEQNLAGIEMPAPEDASSKLFRIHHITPFRDFATRDDLVDLVAQLLHGDEIDFLSQFIFRSPGALGQPCHQDSYYFPFTPARPIVGAWFAVTQATVENGCLYVLPGSHREPVHEHVVDRRPEREPRLLRDRRLRPGECGRRRDGAGRPVAVRQPLHALLDRQPSRQRRAAIVYHYARAGTADHTIDRRGFSINDWMPVRRQAGPRPTESVLLD